MTRAVIGLGSNVGSRLKFLRLAVRSLRDLGTVISVSSLFESDPIGGPPQDPYLNAAVLIDTDLEPEELLAGLQQIETDAGRVRRERWGPRTLDLDLICFGSEIRKGDIELPHPRAHLRRFVLEPVVEIAPNVVLADGSTARGTLRENRDQKVFKWEGDWVSALPGVGSFGRFLVGSQLILMAFIAVLGVIDVHVPVGWLRGVAAGVVVALVVWLVIGGGSKLGSELSSLPDPREGVILREEGPYSLVRHPIYGGTILSGVAFALVVGSWLPLIGTGLLAVLSHYKAKMEERSLALTNPEYFQYRRRVPRRFIPFIW